MSCPGTERVVRVHEDGRRLEAVDEAADPSLMLSDMDRGWSSMPRPSARPRARGELRDLFVVDRVRKPKNPDIVLVSSEMLPGRSGRDLFHATAHPRGVKMTRRRALEERVLQPVEPVRRSSVMRGGCNEGRPRWNRIDDIEEVRRVAAI